jgi:hypothetical protein
MTKRCRAACVIDASRLGDSSARLSLAWLLASALLRDVCTWALRPQVVGAWHESAQLAGWAPTRGAARAPAPPAFHAHTEG